MKRCAVVQALLLCGAAIAQPLPADVQTRALAAATAAEARALLGVTAAPEPGRRVLLVVPDIVAVPLRGAGKATIRVTSELPSTEWIAVFVDPAPRALAFIGTVAPGARASVETVVTVTRTAQIRAVVRAGGRFYEVAREVKVATPGCRAE